jgi:hypothetical protein
LDGVTFPEIGAKLVPLTQRNQAAPSGQPLTVNSQVLAGGLGLAVNQDVAGGGSPRGGYGVPGAIMVPVWFLLTAIEPADHDPRAHVTSENARMPR